MNSVVEDYTSSAAATGPAALAVNEPGARDEHRFIEDKVAVETELSIQIPRPISLLLTER